jgi:hypothetical protein
VLLALAKPTMRSPTIPFPSSEIDHVSNPMSLRLIEGTGDQRPERQACASFAERERRSYVLLAGSSEDRRRELLAELSRTLTPSTRFREASVAWEVLQQAPSSRMVILTGDLNDISAESLTRLVGRRYPWLPVLTLDQAPQADDCAAVGMPIRVESATGVLG